MEIIPVFEDRPAVIPHEGGRVFVGVHDQEYLREHAERKARMVAAHPDAENGTQSAFIREKQSFDYWLKRERLWYAQHGLEPPNTKSRSIKVPANILDKVRGYATSGTKLALQILRDGKEYTTEDLTKAGVRSAAHALKRLSTTGLKLKSRRDGRHIYWSMEDPDQEMPPQTLKGTAKRMGASPKDLVAPARLLEILRDQEWHSRKSMEPYFRKPKEIQVHVYRLRQRGYDIRTEVRTGGWGYRLVYKAEE